MVQVATTISHALSQHSLSPLERRLSLFEKSVQPLEMILRRGAGGKALGLAMGVLVPGTVEGGADQLLATPRAKVGPSASLRAIFSVSAASSACGTIS